MIVRLQQIGKTVLALMLATSAGSAVAMDCGPLDQATDARFKLPAKSVENLRYVSKKISDAAGFTAPIFLCQKEELNAEAIAKPSGEQFVVVNTGLLRTFGFDLDILGAILGHEFAHLILDHSRRKTIAFLSNSDEAIRQGNIELDAGIEWDMAISRAKSRIFKWRDLNSRIAEREADDKGFGIATKAGFDPAGPRRFHQKIFEMYGGSTSESYLKFHPGLGESIDSRTHPGTGERISTSYRLELNESMRREAEVLLVKRDARKLREHVAKWNNLVPGSGAASYYLGLYGLLTNRSASFVSEAFEDAVSLFDGESSISRLSQEDENEARLAVLSLCVSLFREEKRLEAFYCIQKVKSPEDVERFKDITGVQNLVVLPRLGDPPGTQTGLYASLSPSDGHFMTNCPHTADGRGLKNLRKWKALREGLPQASSDAEIWECVSGTCNCKPASW